MKNLNKQLTTYYRNIQHHLPCNRKVKKKIIDRIKGTINIYFQENPTTDFNSIQEHFGTPEQIASAYIEEMTTPELVKSFRIRQKIIGLVCTAIAIGAVIWIAVVASAVVNESTQTNGYYDVGLIVEEEKEEYK